MAGMYRISRAVGRHQRRLLFGLVVFSFGFAWLQGGPLSGSRSALLVVFALQILLPGWLLVRLLRLEAPPLLPVRLAWVLSTGLGLTFALGQVFLQMRSPPQMYVLMLHLLMALMVFLYRANPSTKKSKEDHTTSFWAAAAVSACVAVCCVVSLIFAVWRGGLRFEGWEDQTFFIAPINWLVHDVSSLPLRQRMRSESFLMPYAGLVWSSGVPAERLVWYETALLFGWTPPLAVFALAYALSERTRHAAYCVVAFTLAG